MTNTTTAPKFGEATGHRDAVVAQRTSETKSALKTTEFFVWLAAVIAIAVTAAVVGGSDESGQDPFGAFRALQLITFVTIGYLVARGLAKSGSHEHHDA